MFAETDVSIRTWQTTYVYSRSKLWAAYGAAIISTICALIIATSAVWKNGETYSNNFSTLLVAGHASEFGVEVAVGDRSGSDPLPLYLKKTTIGFQVEPPLLEEMQSMTAP
jgi:hypothetical protein